MSWFKRVTRPRSRWTYHGRTDKGRVRARNEDDFRLLVGEGLLVVADGMGGHRGGETASRCAVDEVLRHFVLGPRPQRTMKRLVAAVRRANEAILETARADPELDGMGCTLVASVVAGEALHTCHLGDARCYVANASRISQISRDHSLMVELREAGNIGDGDVRSHPARNVVTRALGVPMEDPPEYTKANLRRETRVLLCSDGLWGMVDDAEIHRILMASRVPSEACDALVDRANLLGGSDNITAVVGFRES